MQNRKPIGASGTKQTPASSLENNTLKKVYSAAALQSPKKIGCNIKQVFDDITKPIESKYYFNRKYRLNPSDATSPRVIHDSLNSSKNILFRPSSPLYRGKTAQVDVFVPKISVFKVDQKCRRTMSGWNTKAIDPPKSILKKSSVIQTGYDWQRTKMPESPIKQVRFATNVRINCF